MSATRFSRASGAPYIALVLITLAGACANGEAATVPPTLPPPSTDPAPSSQAGAVTGVARDARGQPIANALVEVKMVFNPNVVTTRTGTDGRYTVRGLPAGLSHQVKAWTEVAYRGKSYCVRLGMPNDADYDAFVPSTAVVRDFRWQLTGRVPDAPANVFGAGVDVDTWEVSGIRTGDEIEVQFTAQGPLVDGSAGGALTRVVRFGSNLAINDIPHGIYTAAATLVRDGVRTPLRVARAGLGAELAATTTVEWEPELAGAACNQKLGPALKRFPLKVSNR